MLQSKGETESRKGIVSDWLCYSLEESLSADKVNQNAVTIPYYYLVGSIMKVDRR